MTVALARRRAPRARHRDRTAAFVIGGLVAVMLAAAVAGLVGSGGSAESTTASADAWVAAAEDAFAPIRELPEVSRVLDDWRQGRAGPGDVAPGLESLSRSLAAVEPALVELGPHPDAPLAAPLHLATARLYEVVVDVESIAVGMPAGDAARQVDLVARRLQVLANRVFDRGRAAVGQGPAAELGPDIVVHRPDEVPSWAVEDLAAGAPFAGAPAPVVSGPWPDWLTAARAVLPTDLAIVDGTPAPAPMTRADRIEAAVLALRRVPDDGGGDRSTRVLLGLLLRVEAARLDVAAAITGETDLRVAADRVESVAAASVFWDDALGPRP